MSACSLFTCEWEISRCLLVATRTRVNSLFISFSHLLLFYLFIHFCFNFDIPTHRLRRSALCQCNSGPKNVVRCLCVRHIGWMCVTVVTDGDINQVNGTSLTSVRLPDNITGVSTTCVFVSAPNGTIS